jgi:hypothetical protein
LRLGGGSAGDRHKGAGKQADVDDFHWVKSSSFMRGVQAAWKQRP